LSVPNLFDTVNLSRFSSPGELLTTPGRSPLRRDLGRMNLLIVCLSPLFLAWLSAPIALGQTPQDLTVASSVVSLYRIDLEPLAATSCSSSACHGGPQPGVTRPAAAGQSAYGLWLERDPHARSWQTICSPESIAMMTRLGILRGEQIINQAGFDNCLACHNSHRSETAEPTVMIERASGSDEVKRRSATTREFRFPRHTEGVGCAGCHGPAEQWVNEHYLASWQPQEAIARGFVPSDDLMTRARMCASCHVGDHDRDMNHDIIAAGHPALRFEMAAHHSRLPKHWRDDQASDLAGFEAKLWAAGAVASADAWLALQQGRAGGTTAVSTWPDFAANDCSSCHQSLRLNSDRDPLSDPHRRGAAKIARWDIGALQLWATGHRDQSTAVDRSTANSLLSQIDSVRATIEVMPAPDRLAFERASQNLREALPNWVQSQGGNGDRSRQRAKGVVLARPFSSIVAPRLTALLSRSSSIDQATETWEAAAQFYLLLAASRYEWTQGNGGQLQSLAHSIRHGLSLPPQIDSPRYSLASPLSSELTREQMRQLVEQVVRTLDSSSQSRLSPVESAIYSPLPAAFDSRPVLLKDASHASVH